MNLTPAERAALEAACSHLEAAARTCDADSPVGALLVRRAKCWRADLLGAS